MSAADYHLILVNLRAAAQYDPAFIVGRLLDALDTIDGNECATMNADESLLEFFCQGFQRLVDQSLAAENARIADENARRRRNVRVTIVQVTQ